MATPATRRADTRETGATGKVGETSEKQTRLQPCRYLGGVICPVSVLGALS
jgi:hypothetical protein